MHFVNYFLSYVLAGTLTRGSVLAWSVNWISATSVIHIPYITVRAEFMCALLGDSPLPTAWRNSLLSLLTPRSMHVFVLSLVQTRPIFILNRNSLLTPAVDDDPPGIVLAGWGAFNVCGAQRFDSSRRSGASRETRSPLHPLENPTNSHLQAQ